MSSGIGGAYDGRHSPRRGRARDVPERFGYRQGHHAAVRHGDAKCLCAGTRPLRRPLWRIPAHAGDLPPNRQGRAHDGHRSHQRGIGKRQGSGRAHDPWSQRTGQVSVRGRELRCHSGQPDRSGAVRLRKRRLHRGDTHSPGVLRARRRRHALSGRNHGDGAGNAGPAAARARNGPLYPRGRRTGIACDGARDCRDQQGRPASGSRRAICAKT